MRTEHLIHAMAADTARGRRVETQFPAALFLAVAATGLVFLGALGVRDDIAAALTRAPVLLKQIMPWILMIGGFGAAVRLSRPGARVGCWWLLLIAGPVAVSVSMMAELARLPAADWVSATRGTNLVACLTSIPLLSVPIAGASLWVLRDGASTRPRLTGLVTGLMSGAAAAGVYAFHCTDDSPLFFGTWYALAVLFVAAITAVVGSRVLRW